MAEPMLGKDVPNTIEKENVDCKEQVYLEETFYILSKKKSVFRVRLTSKGLSLIKETDDSSKEQTILLRDIIGSKCMRSKRRRAGAGSCVCSSLVGPQQLKVVEENSGDLDESDISAYLYIFAYTLKRSRRSLKRERTTITLRFRSYDKYEDNYKEAQKWRTSIKCLIANQPITTVIPQNDKKLLILLNPKSGPGKARELFQTKSAPLLQEAEVPYDLHITKYAQYAREFVRTRNVYGWRGIVAAGGDGVLFEILNGMFERLDWQQALAEVPLAILPCGSGNGLARTICYHYNEPYIRENLTGISMGLARGRVAPMDVVRVETKTNIMFSFLSVGWGLLSDIDIESERLRAIGGQRFAIWALARLVGLRKYKGVVSYAKIKDVSNLPKPKLPITLSHSVSQDGALDSPDAEAFIDCDEHSEVFTNAVNGKHQRVDSWYSVNSRRSAFYSTRGSEYHSVASGGSEMRSPVHACMHGPASHLPSLMSQLPSHWVHEEGEFVMVHVSYQAYIGEDLLFAPRSQLSDGVMWMLIIKAGIPRSQILSFLLGMGQGTHSDVNTEYIKMIPVSAFRIVPEGSDGYLTVDGELVEYGPLQAEIFPNIVHLLVPDTK
ncbi:PREDICTED: sphingosine kinase 1-like [Papilio xuthus]|uniref:sphingosine kinase n=1 Tax=Papilio xuthus TaxID=66420 RepID=A0A194Q1F0_PAPXU|nr:PREDICTED: sphingosine kinase 1-like [Papilio xuthus]KPI97225.1 Sphingosine kinase 2 [Papilio xuthus]